MVVEFFPMTHLPTSLGETPRPSEEYFLSQYSTMTYIVETNAKHVFVEGNFETLNKEDFVGSNQDAKSLLAQVPFLYEHLNSDQRQAIVDHRLAVNLMLRAGHLDFILPAQSEEQFYESFKHSDSDFAKALAIESGLLQPASEDEKQWAKEVCNYLTEKRELAALDQIKKFSRENPTVQKVTLLFGASHDFLSHQDNYPELKIRKINVRKYRRTTPSFVSGAINSEPHYDNFVYNQNTGLLKLLPTL